MAYVGKTIAMVGILIFIIKYLLPVVGFHPGGWMAILGIIIIIIGAIIHIGER